MNMKIGKNFHTWKFFIFEMVSLRFTYLGYSTSLHIIGIDGYRGLKKEIQILVIED